MINKKQKLALTTLQAFKVMYAFLEDYYERTSSDDVGGLLSDLQFLEDGGTADPAAWDDWLQAVQKVMGEKDGNKK